MCRLMLATGNRVSREIVDMLADNLRGMEGVRSD